MMPPSHTTCHETGHKKKCIDLCTGCWKWVQIQGHNPNTGVEESTWKCADAWLPILLIENSQQQRQTGAAVESFRNEMVKSNLASQAVLAATAKTPQRLEGLVG